MSDDNTTSDEPVVEDEKVAQRKIEPEVESFQAQVEGYLTAVSSELDDIRSIQRSQTNVILACVGFIIIILLTMNRDRQVIRELVEAASNVEL